MNIELFLKRLKLEILNVFNIKLCKYFTLFYFVEFN